MSMCSILKKEMGEKWAIRLRWQQSGKPTLLELSLETENYLQTEHDMEINRPNDFSCQVAEDSRSSWLQT